MPNRNRPLVPICPTNAACDRIFSGLHTDLELLKQSHRENAKDISEVTKKLDRLVWGIFSLVVIAAAQLLFYVITRANTPAHL